MEIKHAINRTHFESLIACDVPGRTGQKPDRRIQDANIVRQKMMFSLVEYRIENMRDEDTVKTGRDETGRDRRDETGRTIINKMIK